MNLFQGRRQRHLPRTGTIYTSIRPRPQAHRLYSLALGTHSQSQHQNQISTQLKRGKSFFLLFSRIFFCFIFFYWLQVPRKKIKLKIGTSDSRRKGPKMVQRFRIAVPLPAKGFGSVNTTQNIQRCPILPQLIKFQSKILLYYIFFFFCQWTYP